ncbi:MAG: 3-oxoacyl-[acyl-carrier-protein] reductase [Acidobacteria bacterium]|nr:3-oxoacyl-[acyl-carrier-protein] reductase [Acidobacteriota bacterium]
MTASAPKTRVALVTGASQGIGRACALDLASAGYRVIIAARSADKLAELAEEIRASGAEAHPVALDLSDAASIAAAAKAAEEAAGGPIDILVNNAGVTRDGLAMRMSAEAWNEVIQTNLTGAFLLTQAVMRGMIKQRWGRIINISSVVGQSGNPGQANYVASKAGLIGLTKSLALELAGRNVTVNAVAPGFIETAMTAALSEQQRAAILDKIPLGRIGAAEDVAAAVRYLASDQAGYVTGHVLNVNGGMYV